MTRGVAHSHTRLRARGARARARARERRGDILGAGKQSDSRTVSIRELYFETSNPAST